jgi:hypothetical protein
MNKRANFSIYFMDLSKFFDLILEVLEQMARVQPRSFCFTDGLYKLFYSPAFLYSLFANLEIGLLFQ